MILFVLTAFFLDISFYYIFIGDANYCSQIYQFFMCSENIEVTSFLSCGVIAVGDVLTSSFDCGLLDSVLFLLISWC